MCYGRQRRSSHGLYWLIIPVAAARVNPIVIEQSRGRDMPCDAHPVSQPASQGWPKRRVNFTATERGRERGEDSPIEQPAPFNDHNSECGLHEESSNLFRVLLHFYSIECGDA